MIQILPNERLEGHNSATHRHENPINELSEIQSAQSFKTYVSSKNCRHKINDYTVMKQIYKELNEKVVSILDFKKDFKVQQWQKQYIKRTSTLLNTRQLPISRHIRNNFSMFMPESLDKDYVAKLEKQMNTYNDYISNKYERHLYKKSFKKT